MELILERKIKNKKSTEGNLYVKQTGKAWRWFANTIEDAVRAAPGQWKANLKVYAQTAIPYGVYPVLVTDSARFKRPMVGIFSVPDFEGIRIHWGTTGLSSAGCIIISYKDDDVNHKLVYDKQATEDLIKLIGKTQKTEKIHITIVDRKEDAAVWINAK